MSSTTQPSFRELFTSFLRLGLTAFGGPSMVAYIRKMSIEKKGWLDPDTFDDGVALCQAIPGATAMQTAAYVGLKLRGVMGAGASYIGFGLPAFLIMMLFSALYTYTNDLPIMMSAFNGLQAIIVAIIANATLSFGKTTLKDWRMALIAGMAAAIFGFKMHPILVILIAGMAGLILITPKARISNQSLLDSPSLTYTKQLMLVLSISAAGLFLLWIFHPALFHLALLMLKIDLFAFGGGFASIPLMLHEVVEGRQWMDSQTLMNGIVLGQITPGPIVITATFIGYLLAGPLGGVIATISIFLPSFVVLVGVTPFVDRLKASPAFNKTLGGVLCSFVGLLLATTIRFALDVPWDIYHAALAIGALVALLLKVDILWVVLIGTIISVFVFY
jgi:chromate transporter